MVNKDIFSFFATLGRVSQNIKAVHRKQESGGTGMFLQKLVSTEVGRVMVDATFTFPYLTGLLGFSLSLGK